MLVDTLRMNGTRRDVDRQLHHVLPITGSRLEGGRIHGYPQ